MFTDLDPISSRAYMSDLEHHAHNVADGSKQMKKARKRRLLTWIGTSKYTNVWLRQRPEVNTEVGMLTNW